MSTKKEPAHHALASARRAIRDGVSKLTPAQVFHLAAYVSILQTGEDRGRWELSASYATEQPGYRWMCDEPSRTGRPR
jgi:hypothetical protein